MTSGTRLPAPERTGAPGGTPPWTYSRSPSQCDPWGSCAAPLALQAGLEPAAGPADVAAGSCGRRPALGHHLVRGGHSPAAHHGIHRGDHLPAPALWLHLSPRRAAALLRWRASLAFFLTDEDVRGGTQDERAQRRTSIPPTRSSRASSSTCSGTWRPCSASPPASTSTGWTVWGWTSPSPPPSSP